VGIGGDQPDSGQAASDEIGEELIPRRPGLTGRDPHPEHFAVTMAVGAAGGQDDGVDDPAAFADFPGLAS
jgi:hypothetical protein